MERTKKQQTEPPVGPNASRMIPWEDKLLELHALVMYRSFCSDLDGRVLPNLGSLAGCLTLMRSIRYREVGRFQPLATWLIEYEGKMVASIQGVVTEAGEGAIQNVGVLPDFRGLGFGKYLVRQALWGYESLGIDRVILEVTADNSPAVKLYRSLGFEIYQTIDKQIFLD